MDTTNNFQQSVNDNLKVFANYQPKGQLGNGTFELSDVGAVARNVGGSLVGGVLSTAEALSDPVLAAYYSITGRQSKAREIYLNSWSQTATDYLRGDDTGGNTMQFVNSIAQGVGEQGTRLAISLGLAAITRGVVNLALTQNVLLGASAFGGGMQNAVQQTGELGLREHLYGIGSGLIEFGTEKLSDVAGLYGGSSKTIGGALGLLNVDGWTSKLLGQYANTVGGKLARTFMGEFGEEALSEILDVPLSKLTIDENASTSLKDVLAAGVQGGIVGAIMGGGQEVLNKSNYTKRGTDIVNNNLQGDVLKEGLELGNDYATYLQNRINAGAEVTPTQYGKLAMENQAKIVENGVEEIKDKYGIKSDKEARKKYADEVALDMMYANNGAGMFLTDETNTAENANAIEAYVQNGGSLDDLSDAARMLDRKGITVNYVYDTANDAEGTTIDGNNITINLASEKFKSQIASHESYHTLSDEAKANLYNEISQTQWFKDNGQKILDRYSYEKTGDERTKNYTDEMRQEEVGARYMEQLINNPKAFIKEMQGKSGVIDDLTAFFKGYNKYSKNLPKSEKKAINKVYNEFLDAMKEAVMTPVDLRYFLENSSIKIDKNGKYLNIQLNSKVQEALNKVSEKERKKHVMNFINEHFRGIEFKLDDGKIVSVTRKGSNKISETNFEPKLRTGLELNKLLDVAKYIETNDKVIHKKYDAFVYYKARVKFGDEMYSCMLNVGKIKDTNDYQVYDVYQFEQIKEDSSAGVNPLLGYPNEGTHQVSEESSNKNYTHNSKNVNSFNENNTNGKKYSLPDTDSEGRKLTEAQREFFADSKVVDDRGELQVVYHGTMSGAFTVFDASYSNVESDMGAGFYFSSTYDDVARNYENGGQDFENKISRLAERIEMEEDVDYEEAKEIAKNRLAKGSNLFEVYLNIKNPAYVGGEYDTPTTLFEDFFDYSDINEEDFDSEDDYWEAREQYESEAIDEFAYKVNSILDAEGIDNYEDYLLALQENGVFEGVTVNQLKDIINESVHDASDQKGNYASNEVARVIIEALGYDGIIDNTVVDKFGYNSGRYSYMEGIEDDTRHYIAFYPEQIKLVDNETPTADKDIRFSLSEKDVDKYTTAQYNNFGWVRANDVLTARQWYNFNQKYNEIKFQKHGGVHKNSSGEYIVAVNDMIGDSFGVNNVLVFVKGSPDKPKITQVIKINSNDETELDSIRREIYESKGVPAYYYFEGVLERSTLQDFPRWETRRGNNRQSSRDTSEVRNGRRSVESDRRNGVSKTDKESGDTLFSLPEKDYENVLAHVDKFKSIKAINEYFDKKIDELDEYKNDREKYMSEVEKIAEKEKAVIDKWQELKDAKKAERKADAAIIREVKNTIAFYNDEAFADSMPDEKWRDPKSKKIYTKSDIKRILDNVIKTELDDVYDLKYDGKKGALSDLTYQAFNKATEKDKLGVAMTVAEYLVDNAVLDESSEYEGVKSEALRVVDEISPYLHSFNLKSLRNEINYHYDRSALPVYSRWGYRGHQSGVEVDDIYMILESDGIVSGNNWDAPSQFFEIVEKYDAALAELKKSYKTAAKELFSDGEYRNIVENVANKLVEAYDANGKKDALTVARDLNRTLKEQIKELRGQVRTVALEKNVSMQIQRMTQSAKEFAKRKYSSQAFSGEEAMAVNDAFSKVVVGSKISTDNAIHAVAVAKNFYTPERINGTIDGEATIGLYNQGIANDIEALSQTLEAGKSLDLDQLAALNRVMKAVTHVFRNIDTVIYEDKRRNTAEIGQKIIDEQRALPKVGKFFKQIRFFAENTCDPLAVFNLVNGYNDEATMVKMFNDVRNGETLMTTTKLNVLREFNDFGDAHKKYAKRLGTATVKLTVNDRATGVTEVREIPLDIAMQLYLTSKREHAQRGLFEAGFTYTDKDGYHRYLPTEEAVAEMYNNFTDEDKEYLKIAHKFFNKTCRDIKIAKDNEIYGFTNVEEGDDYIPIRRDDGIFTSPFNITSYMKDFQTVSSLSMNKQTVKGTKSAISMQGLSAVVNMHAQQISLYNGLYEPIMAFTKVWDRNVTGKSTDVQSVKLTVRERTGSDKVEMYVSDLLKGIQGNSKVPQSKVISWMRSSYAKFQLGANLKTVAIQTSSYPMAMMYIKPKYLAKATKPTLPKATVYKYCPFLEVRATDSQFAKAQGVIDDVQGFTNILLKPIGVVDDAMTRRIFEAACYEVAEGTNREVFSDANMKEAAILTEKTVRNTQANALTSEKTAMMRSGSDLVKSLVMFSSDASKQLSRVADAIGFYYFAKRSKNENKIKAAKDGLTRSMATVTTSVAACTLIGLLVKHALGREDDEKEFIQEYVTDFFGQLTGLVPIMRDAYTFFTDGYEVSNFAIDTVNNVYSGVNSSIKMLNRVINGEVLTDDEIVAPLKKVIFAAGQISGIPTRNIINQPTYFVKKWFLKEDSKQQKALFGNTSSSGSAISGDMFTVKK